MIQPGFHNKKINEVSELAISGSGYESAEAALGAGRKWRQVMSSIFARMILSVDFGGDDEEKIAPEQFKAGGLLQKLGLASGEIVYTDRFGFLVHKTEPKRRFVNLSMGTPLVYVSLGEQATHDLTDQALQRHTGDWSDELKLAYELVHASMADDNPEARFILLVTAIEALIPYRERIPPVVAVLDLLIAHANQQTGINKETLEAVLRLLESDKFESVRSYGLKLADRLSGEYDGKAPRKYFDDVYETRSDLAHGNLRNIPKLSTDALNQQYSELLRFVLDILESWTPDYSETGARST